MRYGPLSYFSLGRVAPQTRLREPFPYKRRRRNQPGRILGASSLAIGTRRTATIAINLTVNNGDKFRIRIQQTSGADAARTLPRASVFNINK